MPAERQTDWRIVVMLAVLVVATVMALQGLEAVLR
jgi:hypothetical protein